MNEIYEIIVTKLNCEGNRIGIESLGFYARKNNCEKDLQDWKDKWYNDHEVRMYYSNDFRMISHMLKD